MSSLVKTLIITFILMLSAVFSSAQNFIGDEKDIQSILKNIANFSHSFMNDDPQGMADAYTSDGKIFPNGDDIIVGQEGLLKYWTLPDGVKVKYHKVTPLEIYVNGDRADDHGYYEGTTISQDGKTSSWKGKYVIIWKKINGEWKIYLDIWNGIQDVNEELSKE